MDQPTSSRGAAGHRRRDATTGPCLLVAGPDGGQVLVELAMVLPLLVILLVGAIDLGRLAYVAAAVTNAARAGAIYGSQTQASAADSAGMIQAAQNEVNQGVTLSSVVAVRACRCSSGTVDVACTTTCASPQRLITYAQVTANSVYSPWFPYPGIPGSTTVSKTVSMRVGQ